jgi:hypothetical protein
MTYYTLKTNERKRPAAGSFVVFDRSVIKKETTASWGDRC